MPKPRKNEAKQDYLKRCTKELIDSEGKSTEQAYAACNAYWDDEHSQRAALSLTAPVQLAAKEGSPEGFLITAYTGQVIERGWWGKLVIDTDGIKTKAKLPILREHFRDRVVGFGVKSWKENHNLFIQGDYSAKTKDGQEVRDLADEGFPWEASIGVWPKKVKMLESDKEEIEVNGLKLKGPLEVWTESEVREVSFVAIGADDRTAAINFSQEENKVKVHIERGQPQNHKEDQLMPITLEQMEKEAPELLQQIRDQAREDGVASGKMDGIQAERARVMEILEADGDAAVTKKAIADGASPVETYKALFQAEKTKRAQALTDLETQAPSPMGQTPPPEPQSQAPEAQLTELARTRAKEQGISLDEALEQVAGENPELLREWSPAQAAANISKQLGLN